MVRELPPSEWHRLKGTELESVKDLLSPSQCIVLVDEDREEKIIGTWSLQMWCHVEGFGIAPEHRKRGSVALRLFEAMAAKLEGMKQKGVLTGAMTEDMETWLDRLGASPLPGKTYLWPTVAMRAAVTKKTDSVPQYAALTEDT